MMTPGQPAGAEQMLKLEDLLDIIRNEAIYTKRIAELKEQEAATNKSAEKLTKAKDLDKALTDAKRAHEKADAALKQAEKQAAEIIEAANQQKATVVAAQEMELGALREKSAKFQEYIEQLSESALIAKNQLAQVESDKQRLTAEAAALFEENAKLTNDIHAKRKKFEALLS